mmetsp:Transcript_26426/g.79125  ORF Transcript_26426/g.79125 Transcript_26426/m.79125 type:complete len:112 (+) Transcript_26426:106-441(+)
MSHPPTTYTLASRLSSAAACMSSGSAPGAQLHSAACSVEAYSDAPVRGAALRGSRFPRFALAPPRTVGAGLATTSFVSYLHEARAARAPTAQPAAAAAMTSSSGAGSEFAL